MKKLVFALNNFLEAFDESDFYHCELKNNYIRISGDYNAVLAQKFDNCGWSRSFNGGIFTFRQGLVCVQLVRKYQTDGHVK